MTITKTAGDYTKQPYKNKLQISYLVVEADQIIVYSDTVRITCSCI